jgi:transglutaminase-like putative cysteine protease/predicted small secreted protein
MKRAIGLIVALVAICALALGGWWFLHRNAEPPLAEQFPTVMGPCPDDSNDLAGIEGWAPGAGQASKMGNTGAGNMGGLGGALGGEATTPAPVATGCRLLAPAAVAYFQRVDDLRQAIPNDGDPGAAANALADAQAVFAFVRDRIHTDVYPGAMRGQIGALASRGGSSADKAVLLGGLLGAKSVPARYVHAQLNDADAARVVAAALLTPSQQSDPAAQDVAQKLASDFHVDLNAARQSYSTARSALDARTDSAITDARAHVADLAKQLADAKEPLSSTDRTRTALLANVRDHWWVQAQMGGAWVDLDPTLPDAKPGSHLGGSPTGDPVTEIPDNLKTTITVRLLGQTLDASGLHEATLVEATANTQVLYQRTIGVGLGARDNGAFDPLHVTSFVPSISMAGTDQTGDPVTPDPANGARLATVRLQIVSAVPGQPPVTSARVLLDRRAADGKSIDASWTPASTAYAMTQHATLLAMAGDFNDNFALSQDLANTLRYGAAAAYGIAGGSGTQQAPADLAQPFPVEAMHFFQQDGAVRQRLESQTSGLHFLYDRPVIVMVARGFSFDGAKPSVIERFDIVSNTMAAAGSDVAPTANAIRGYEDTAVEQTLLGVTTDGGTPAYMRAAAAAGVPTSVANDPRYGGVAIVTQRAVTFDGRPRTGWWQIDPVTGNLVGRMDDGAGQALSEYVTQMNDTMSMYSAISFYADMLRCQAFGITAPLRGESGPAGALGYLNCMKGAACSFLEGFAAGELYARQDADLQALAYNILDLSFDTHLGVSKTSWTPPGVWCSTYSPP